MAAEVAEKLKECALKLSTSKTKDRVLVCEEVLIPCILRDDFSDACVKAVFRLLFSIQVSYRDNRSRRALEKVVKTLAEKHGTSAVKYFCGAFSSLETYIKKCYHSPSTSGGFLVPFKWSCILVSTVYNQDNKCQGAEWIKLVQCQSLAVYGVLCAGDRIVCNIVANKLQAIWKKILGIPAQYAKAISESEPSEYTLSLAGLLFTYCSKSKVDYPAIAKFKKPLIDVYIKNVLMSKTKLITPILKQCSEFLCHLNRDDFSDLILPVLLKSLLRSPEVILECTTYLISSLSIDLSKFAVTICKNISGQFKAKEEIHRQQALSVIQHLADHCSDPNEVSELLSYLFGVLSGSEGKLTVWNDRVTILEAIGKLEGNSIGNSSSMEGLVKTVIDKMVPYIQQEVQETVVVSGLSVMTHWCKHITSEVPKQLLEAFKKGMSNKVSTAVVQSGFIQCMGAALKGNTLLQGLDILPQLLQAIDRAVSQPHQVAIVTAGIMAASILVRLSLADIKAESKLGSFWTTFLDSKKTVFVAEKYLMAASSEALQALLSTIETLFISHSHHLTTNNQPWYHAILFLLTNKDFKLYQDTKLFLHKLCVSSGQGSLAHQSALLSEFSSLLLQQQTMVKTKAAMNGDVNGVDDSSNTCISAKILCNVLQTLAVMPYKSNDSLDESSRESIALSIIPYCHHPLLVSYKKDFWVEIVSKLKLDPCSFVQKYDSQILNLIVNKQAMNEIPQNILSTLAIVSPPSLPNIIKHLITNLGDNRFVQVTLEDVGVMETPEGQIYSKKVLESLKQSEKTKFQNVKKESRAYSYEDQKWEMELEKERLQKKKASGLLSFRDELSEKEKEVYDNQLIAEAEIRTKTLQIKEELYNLVMLLLKATESNQAAMGKFIPSMLPVLLSLLKSPLAAPLVVPVILALRKCVFEEKQNSFGMVVTQATLRLLQPQCQLDRKWCQEELQSAVTRAVDGLHALTTPTDDGGPHPLSAPSFAYCFPLLNSVLRAGGAAVKKNDDLRLKALQIVSYHCQLRSQSDDEESDESGPELLPRTAMFTLLTEIISTSSDSIKGSRLQQLASLCLVELCKSISGEEGCSVAEEEELEVLLKGLESPSTVLRFSVLKGLTNMTFVLPQADEETDFSAKVLRRIFVSKFDTDEENAALGKKLWDETQYPIPESLCSSLLEDVVHDVGAIREAAGSALREALSQHLIISTTILHQLFELYDAKLKIPLPVMNELGRVISDPFVDPYSARSGIAQALGKLSPCLDEDQVAPLFSFYVPLGLGDRHEEVRKDMLNAALQAITDHGKDNIGTLLPVFEEFLDLAPDSSAHDTIRQSVIIMMGSLAKHLDKDDPKVKPIVSKLMGALSTPSQQVQQAVANCLPPLVPAIKAEAPEHVEKLLHQLLESTVYGERRGAAYGLAGMVKGLGILYLKQLNIMNRLQDAIQNKKVYRHREGALFAFEMLCTMLGRLFEPYVVHLLPHLLLCFGDGNQYVREATDDTARAVMKHLSAHGVKLVLPSLLAALNEDSWRTKSGSVELLGAMAYCAPKQLSSCLPSIVPQLCKVLTDSHLKVQNSGAQALKQIGSVIRNPEIQAISSVLLEALMDPSTKTAPCLQVLLQTSFVHFIDAPSLALIMPVLQRALNERSTETKKMASQIIGNMYALTDAKDLLPYLSSVVPGLKQSLLDPVPEVRAVSARALGALVKGMGEDHFEDLLPWLMETLTSENSSVDRSGAAQGLSEVLCGLGKERLEKLMPEVISTTEKSELASHVREGYLMLYIYLPTTFKEDFTPYVGPILPSILQGLADEVEFVRDTSLRAGQRVVNVYAETAIELFLPELENGLFDDNWRIRHSSIQLLGDLLYKISGVTGKMSTEGDEDDNFGTSVSNQKIIDSLGSERRNRVLAGLYMGRSDVSLMVRQAALHVWKVIVPNTPRVLREILSTLFSLLLGCLASKSFDKRQVAARTLGDLVRKLGERVLPEIIPILENGLNSDKSNERQGVCVGLSEIISSTSRDQVIQYVDSLVPTVRRALCDELSDVRKAAAKTFDNLYSTIGSKALEDILPDLLYKMDDPSLSEYALDGLRQVMQVNSRVVLPFLVPKLIAPPVNSRALAILSSVAGEALTNHLSKILPALLNAMQTSDGRDSEQQELDAAKKLVLSVESEAGVKTVIEELIEVTKHQKPGMRKAAIILLHTFCNETRADYSVYIQQLFRYVIHLLNDDDVDVVVNSWNTLNAIISKLDASEQVQYIGPLRQAIKYVQEEVRNGELPGFCLPQKGIKCILPVFREGILNGTPELKEQAAYGLGEVINLTSAAALKPSVVHITGPLIRILGDRFSWNVKVAVLETLGLLLGKVGVLLKPFLPQLQTTFVKALNDPNKNVRLKAASALHKLVTLHTRVDPLFTELQNGVKNNEDFAIKETLLQALRGVISGAGQKMGEGVRKTLTTTLVTLLGHGENNIRVATGICIGSLALVLPDDELESLINDHLTVNDPTIDWTLRHGHAIALSAVLHDAPEKVMTCGLYDVITDAAVAHASTDRIPIGSYGVRSLGFLLSQSKQQSRPPSAPVVQTLAQNIKNSSIEVRSLAAYSVKFASDSNDQPFDTTTLKTLVPSLIGSAKDKNSSVKAASESALAALLKLTYNDDTLQTCIRFLDNINSDLLNDMCKKSLRRIANQDDFGINEITSPYNMDLG